MAATALVEDRAPARGAPAGWEAHLELRFEREASRAVLAARRHIGPLRVQEALYPEGPGVCQVIVVHPPGGIVGGAEIGLFLERGTVLRDGHGCPRAVRARSRRVCRRPPRALGCGETRRHHPRLRRAR